MLYDTIIIGSGPAGMTAGIYAARREMKALIIGKDIGGQMTKTPIIENYSGVDNIDGISLGQKIKKQAEKFGTEFKIGLVTKIEKDGENFKIFIDEKIYNTKTVILAFGLEKRKLGLVKEKEYEGKGISYCFTCDGPMFKNKNVAVVGGGNSGAEAVKFFSLISPKVYWLEIMEELIADQSVQNKIKELNNVEILTNTKITDLIGKPMLKEIKIESNGEERNLELSGVFVEIGYVAQSDWLNDLVEIDQHKQIKTNKLTHTSLPGVFAVGDCTDVKYKQIVVAEGEGAIAALEVYEYINK